MTDDSQPARVDGGGAEDRQKKSRKTPASRPEATPGKAYFFDDKSKWYAFPPKEMLRLLAVGNIANFTDDLDYVSCRTPMRSAEGEGLKFQRVTEAFCDNFLVRCIVPSYHLRNPTGDDAGDDDTDAEEEEGYDQRTKRYIHFGAIASEIRKELDAYQAGGVRVFKNKHDVKPVPMAPFNEEDEQRLRELVATGKDGWAKYIHDHNPNLHRETDHPTDKKLKKTIFYWQSFKVAVPKADLQHALAFVKSSVLLRHRVFFKDFDTTIDCGGVFHRQELFDWLTAEERGTERFRVEHSGAFKRTDSNNTILDNVPEVGHNCLSWMTTVKDSKGRAFRVRLKIYLKLVQELEKAAVRANIGQHIWDWLVSMGSRLANARDATTNVGMTRAEITVYYDRRPVESEGGTWGITVPHFDEAHTELDSEPAWMTSIAERAVDVVPKELVYACPHSDTVKAWVGNMKHCLVVYDTTTNCGMVCYSYHRVTKALSAQWFTNWATLSVGTSASTAPSPTSPSTSSPSLAVATTARWSRRRPAKPPIASSGTVRCGVTHDRCLH